MDEKDLYKEALENTNLLESYFRKEAQFNEADTAVAMQWAAYTLILIHNKGFPITSKKFPEVFRAIANLLELRFCKKDSKDG